MYLPRLKHQQRGKVKDPKYEGLAALTVAEVGQTAVEHSKSQRYC